MALYDAVCLAGNCLSDCRSRRRRQYACSMAGSNRTPKDHFERSFGLVARGRYWKVLEGLFVELGYRDYIGDLQRKRAEHPRHMELLSMSSFLWITPSPPAVSSGPRCADAAAQGLDRRSFYRMSSSSHANLSTQVCQMP